MLSFSLNRTRALQSGVIIGSLIMSSLVFSTPSHAGIVDVSSVKNAVTTVFSGAVGAGVGITVAGALIGPPAITAAAGAAVAITVTAVTYTAVSQSIQHPVAAIQTVVAINPITGPSYVASHQPQVINGGKQIWNYFFN